MHLLEGMLYLLWAVAPAADDRKVDIATYENLVELLIGLSMMCAHREEPPYDRDQFLNENFLNTFLWRGVSLLSIEWAIGKNTHPDRFLSRLGEDRHNPQLRLGELLVLGRGVVSKYTIYARRRCSWKRDRSFPGQ